MDTFHICVTSIDLDELPLRGQKSSWSVGRMLADHGRFSVFDATSTEALARTMGRIWLSGWFVFEPQGYPWIKVTITDKGRKALRVRSRSAETSESCCGG